VAENDFEVISSCLLNFFSLMYLQIGGGVLGRQSAPSARARLVLNPALLAAIGRCPCQPNGQGRPLPSVPVPIVRGSIITNPTINGPNATIIAKAATTAAVTTPAMFA
jgi:hypothetical protein